MTQATKKMWKIKMVVSPTNPMVGIIANDEGDDTILAKTGLWEVPLAHFTADEIVKAVNCHDELVEALKKSQLALNSVLKYSHGDDLVDLHDEAYYANIKINEALAHA